MNQEGDLRRHTRSTQAAQVQIVWNHGVLKGRIINVSESGMRVEVSDPLEKQTYVTLQAASLGLHGSASVRTCTRKGMKYLVGLEFSAGLKWKPKS